MDELEEILRAVAEERALDPRTDVLDVVVEERDRGLVLAGQTTLPETIDAIVARLSEARGVPVVDDVVRLPDAALGVDRHALVRVAIAPVHVEPRVSSTPVSQYVLGNRLDLLARRDGWWRVRGEDGYIGWIHHGYLEVGAAAWAQAWERGENGEPMVSLGAELVDEAGRCIARLPWGARVIRDAPRQFRLPDARHGEVSAGELVEADRLVDWFPPRGESVIRTARRWLGTPYLWGGVTRAGTDCSGFVQAVFWMHGIALPRDSDQQARIGSAIEPSPDFAELRAGDIVYFSERPDRITHVAISLGGSLVIHSALSNGGVAENDLLGGLEVEQRLQPLFTTVRRVLPD